MELSQTSTKSSNIVGILSLGVIRKRLVEFRLDFLAFIRIDQILTSPSLVDIPPVFVFVQSLRQATKNGHRVFLWVPQQFLMPAGPCIKLWFG